MKSAGVNRCLAVGRWRSGGADTETLVGTVVDDTIRPTTEGEATSVRTLMRAGATGTVTAVVFVSAVFFVADAGSGPLLAEGPDGELGEASVVGAVVLTTIGGVVGAAIAFVLRTRERAELRFLNICAVFLVIYGAWAFNQAERMSTGIWLNVMHLAAAAPIIDQLRRWLRSI